MSQGTWSSSGRQIWFLHGNFSQDFAIELVERARSLLSTESAKPVAKVELADIRCIALSDGSWHRIELPLEDKENDNSCLVTYFEGAYLMG